MCRLTQLSRSSGARSGGTVGGWPATRVVGVAMLLLATTGAGAQSPQRIPAGARIRVCAPPPIHWQEGQLVQLDDAALLFRSTATPALVDSVPLPAVEGLEYQVHAQSSGATRGVLTGAIVGALVGVALQHRGRSGDEFRGVGAVRFGLAGALGGAVVGLVVVDRPDSPVWVRTIGGSGSAGVACHPAPERPEGVGASG